MSATSLNIFPLMIKDAIVKGHLLSLCPQALKAMTFSLGEVLGEGHISQPPYHLSQTSEKIEFPHVSTGNHSWSLLVGR